MFDIFSKIFTHANSVTQTRERLSASNFHRLKSRFKFSSFIFSLSFGMAWHGAAWMKKHVYWVLAYKVNILWNSVFAISGEIFFTFCQERAKCNEKNRAFKQKLTERKRNCKKERKYKSMQSKCMAVEWS